MINIDPIKLIFVILLLVSMAAGVFFGVKYFKEVKDHRDTKIELSVKTDTLTHLADENGKIYARIGEYNKTISELKHSNDSIEQKMFTEAKLNNIRNNQINKLQYALIEVRDSLRTSIGKTNIIIHGIMYDKKASFNNGFLSADLYFSVDSNCADLTYKYVSELYMTDSWSKPKFFLWRWFGLKGKTQQFDFKSSDPNAEIKVLRSINVNN